MLGEPSARGPTPSTSVTQENWQKRRNLHELEKDCKLTLGEYSSSYPANRGVERRFNLRLQLRPLSMFDSWSNFLATTIKLSWQGSTKSASFIVHPRPGPLLVDRRCETLLGTAREFHAMGWGLPGWEVDNSSLIHLDMHSYDGTSMQILQGCCHA